MERIRRTTQLKTEISNDDAERLDRIIEEYNFKSRYQVLRYLTECFLKVADPRPEEIVNADIEEMFEGFESMSSDDFQDTKRSGSI